MQPVITVQPLNQSGIKRNQRKVSFSYDRFSPSAATAAIKKIKSSHLVSDCFLQGAEFNETHIIVCGRWHWPFRSWLTETVCKHLMRPFDISSAIAEIHHPLPGEKRQSQERREIYCLQPFTPIEEQQVKQEALMR